MRSELIDQIAVEKCRADHPSGTTHNKPSPVLDSRRHSISLEPHGEQRLLQTFQAAAADEANRSDGQTKTLRDLAVRQRRLDVKQQPDHLLAPWRETRGRIPHDLLALGLIGHVIGRYCGVGAERVVVEGGLLDIGSFAMFALPVERLVRRNRDEPAAQRRRFSKMGQLREQLETYRLKNVAGILGTRAVLDRNRVDEVLVLINQCRPCLLVAIEARLHETFVTPSRVRPMRRQPARAGNLLTACPWTAFDARTIPRRSRGCGDRGLPAESFPALYRHRPERWG